MSNDIAGIEENDVLLVIGSNTTVAHPVLALRMKKAVEKGAKLLVADPRGIDLARQADVWLRQWPGTDGALIAALCHVILREGLENKAFIASRTENFEAFAASVSDCTPAWAEEITGVPAARIEEAARLFARAERGAVYYTMGITQHSTGTANVWGLANLVLLTGAIGRQGTGLNPLRGQNNVQGASDMGCVPTLLPGYQRVDDPAVRARFEALWGRPLSATPGMTATEMTEAMLDRRLTGLWIMGENPVLSDPNASHAREALSRLEFLVVQDLFLTETAELADVVLPAASFAEKEGTFTNTERRVQRVRQAVLPPGKAKDDLSIINLLTARMGFAPSPATPPKRFAQWGDRRQRPATPPLAQEVFQEITQAWPALAGMSYERLDRGGLQWPCPDAEHPGTPYLFKEAFPRGLARFTPVAWEGPKERPDADFPFTLTTGRILYQYHTGTMTRRSPVIEANAPSPFVEIHPDDAVRLGVSDGETVKASSRRGAITLPAKVSDMVGPSVVFIPFHYKEAAANLLTNDALDPVCKIPEAKVCAVRIERLAAAGQV